MQTKLISELNKVLKAFPQFWNGEELGVSLEIGNFCTIRASPACQRRCLRFLSAL